MKLTPAAVLTCWAMVVIPASAGANNIIVNNPHGASFSTETAPSAQHLVSFLDAWQVVVSQNDGLAAERANIERRQNMQDAARDLYLPSISATAKYTRLDKPVEIKPSDLIDSMPIGGVVPTLPLMGILSIKSEGLISTGFLHPS